MAEIDFLLLHSGFINSNNFSQFISKNIYLNYLNYYNSCEIGEADESLDIMNYLEFNEIKYLNFYCHSDSMLKKCCKILVNLPKDILFVGMNIQSIFFNKLNKLKNNIKAIKCHSSFKLYYLPSSIKIVNTDCLKGFNCHYCSRNFNYCCFHERIIDDNLKFVSILPHKVTYLKINTTKITITKMPFFLNYLITVNGFGRYN